MLAAFADGHVGLCLLRAHTLQGDSPLETTTHTSPPQTDTVSFKILQRLQVQTPETGGEHEASPIVLSVDYTMYAN